MEQVTLNTVKLAEFLNKFNETLEFGEECTLVFNRNTEDNTFEFKCSVEFVNDMYYRSIGVKVD